MKLYRELFFSFFRVGLFTFGGGMAMLPLLQAEVVDKKQWATEEELMTYFAVGQCTPGIIAVNTATFVGYKMRGVIGGIVATLGVISPSILIIMSIASLLTNFSSNLWVQHAFGGIRAVVCALILNAIIKLWKAGIKDVFGFCMFLLAFFCSGFFGVSSVWLVIAAIILGNVYQVFKEKRKSEGAV